MLKDFTEELMTAIISTLRSEDEKVKQMGVKHGILLLQTIIPKLQKEEREKMGADLEKQLQEAMRDSGRVSDMVNPIMETGLGLIEVKDGENNEEYG